MKRFLLIVIAAAMLAWAVWFALHSRRVSSSTSVAALVPGETVVFAHLTDFNGMRAQWRETDFYKLSREPAVREFLQKPLANIPKNEPFSRKLQQIERLEIKDAFLAVTSIANNDPKLVGGFHFKGQPQEVENLIGNLRAKALKTLPNAKQETVEYQQHRIETFARAEEMLAIVYDGQWFLASNDLAGLKVLLDRVDGRLRDRDNTLAGNEAFQSASAHMPASYSIFFYLNPKRLTENFAALRGTPGQPGASPQTLLERMNSIGGAFGFERGKMRDVIFVGMPKYADHRSLSRSSIGLGTKDTFLYAGQVLHPDQLPDLSEPSVLNTFPLAFQKFFGALVAAGVTKEDWKSAFEPETGILGDWSAEARWPSILATLPVKDVAKAKRIVTTLTIGTPGSTWTQQEKNGVLYVSMPVLAGLVPLNPTIAVSDKIIIAGPDSVSVEAALKRSLSGSSELAKSQTYETATRMVPAPDETFGYIDTALLYSRLDTALRPMLLVGAAFVPNIGQYVDLNKLPPAEVITKHLTPIVISQFYKNGGYVTESIGPITFTQAAVGVASVATASVLGYRRQTQPGAGAPIIPTIPPMPAPFASPPAVSPTPEETP